MKLPLAEIAAHLRACYPSEGCGLVFTDGRFVPITNVAGRDSVSARTTADGYVMDPKEHYLAFDAAERAGERLYAIVHSHPDVGVYFSKEDQRQALADDGEPIWTGVRYLVVSVRSGNVDGASFFTWDSQGRAFVEEKLTEIAP
jgi:proteasome lid subunit RPN8/RPN11